MKKLLKPSDLLLLGLAGALDVFEEIRDPFGLQASACQFMYGWVPPRYKRHNFGRLVQRQLKTGNIEKKVKKGEVYLRLTSAGQEKIIRDFPLFSFQNQKWDGKWRIVIFDIAEISKKVREVLRRKLKELGFGMFQKSVWISPHNITQDLQEFIETRGWEEEVFVLEVNHLLVGNEKFLVEKIWHISELNEEYQDLLSSIRKVKEMYVGRGDRHTQCTNGVTREVSKEADEEKKKRREKDIMELKRKYLELLLKDPFLPKELLPENWVGEKVRKEIAKI